MDEPVLQTEEEWLAERKLGLGGSDMTDLFSEPPYGCRRMLWYEKRGLEADYPFPTSWIMERGKALEPIVAAMYARREGRELERTASIVSQSHPWARVNLDRRIVGADGRDGPGALEVKTQHFFMFRKTRREGMQPGHILQLQHALFVTGYQWGAFALLHPDSWTLLSFDMARDDRLIDLIREVGERFWRDVMNGPMPEPLPEIDRRCHVCPWRKQCRGELALKSSQMSGRELLDVVEQDETLADVVADYREAKRMYDDAAEVYELVKEALAERMGTRDAVECQGTRIYHREQQSMRIDTAALRSKFPDVAKQVQRVSISRPLKIYLS